MVEVSRTELKLEVSSSAPAGARQLTATAVVPVDGPAADAVLVCWPGGGMHRGYFDLDLPGYSFAEHLAGHGHACVLIDHLGIGGSDKPTDPDDYTTDAVADADAAAVPLALAELGLAGRPVVSVGHSMGALFSVWQQARYQTYDALVLLGIGVTGVEFEAAGQWVEAARAHRADWYTDEEINLGGTAASDLLLAGMPIPREAYAAILATATDFVPTEAIDRLRPGLPELAAVSCPILVGNGERDITCSLDVMGPAFPNATVATYLLADAGHNHNVAPNRNVLWDRIADWVATSL